MIPTAETVGADQFALDLQADGPFNTMNEDTRVINTEFGFGDRFEAGIDTFYVDGEESEKALNAKYVLAIDNKRATSYAVGLCSVAKNSKPSSYLVTTKDMQAFRFHLGAMKIEDNQRWFVGADREIAKNLTLMADYTSGDENLSSVGLSYQLNDRMSVYGAAQYPNGGGDSLFTVHVVIEGPYK